MNLFRLKLTIHTKVLTAIALSLLYLPVIIFLMTWINPVIGFFASAGCVISIILFTRCQENTPIDIHLVSVIIFIALTVIILAYHGALSIFKPQHYDWYKHNTILSDLIEKDWPVVYTESGSNVMLCYYIGIYIIPAVIGKLIGFLPALACMYIQSVIVITTAYICLLRIMHAERPDICKCHIGQEIVIALAFILFALPYGKCTMINFTCFPGGFYITLAVMLSWQICRKAENAALWAVIWFPIALFSVLSLPAAILFAIAFTIAAWFKSGKKIDIKFAFKQLITAGTIFPAVIIILCYLGCNIFQDMDRGLYFRICLTSASLKETPVEIITSMAVTLAIPLLMWKDFRHDLCFISSVIIMTMFMFVKTSYFNDFQSQSCTVTQSFLLIYFEMRMLRLTTGSVMDIKVTDMTLVALSLAMVACVCTIFTYFHTDMKAGDHMTASTTYDGKSYTQELYCINTSPQIITYNTMGVFTCSDELDKIQSDLQYNYFSYDNDTKFFWKYLARK